MINFIKKLFGGKPAQPVVEVPYKVEAVAETPAPVVEKASEDKSVAPAKKPVAKKTGGRPKGPRKPKAPKVQK